MTGQKWHRGTKGDELKSLCGIKGAETVSFGITCGNCNRIHEINEAKALAIWKEAMAFLELSKAERRAA